MTSLRDQLKKLATPATSQLRVDVRKRPSLLYDPHEAAKIDFVVHFERAKEAFEHLSNLEPSFRRFEQSLFSEESIHYDPSTQDPDVHAKTSKRLRKFLVKISAFLQVPNLPLQVLEWLVQRFQMHLYQPDDVMRCVFPYHDSPLFPKFAQLLDLETHDNRRWAWLKPIADNGVPLTKDELLLACARDQNVLLFICNTMELSLKLHRRHPTHAQPALVLFTQIGLGLLTRPGLSEAHLSAVLVPMLPHIEAGLSAGASSKRKASAFMLVQAAANHLHLRKSIVERWLSLVLSNPQSSNPATSIRLAFLLVTQHGLELDEKLREQLKELVSLLPDSYQGLFLSDMQEVMLGEKAYEPALFDESDPREAEVLRITDDSSSEKIEVDVEPTVVDHEADARRKMKELLKGKDAATKAKLLIRVALGGDVPESIFALNRMKSVMSSEDDESVKLELVNTPVHPWLLLILLNPSERVRKAVIACLGTVKACIAALGEKTRQEARSLRKILKVSDDSLLVGDRLFLLQAPFNLRLLSACMAHLSLEQLLPLRPEAPAEDKKAWLFVCCRLLELLTPGSLEAFARRCPELPGRLLDLLATHKPLSEEGAVLWPLWKPQLLEAMPAELADRAFDVWLEAAGEENATDAVRAAFTQLPLSVAQTKRLLSGFLPRKGAMSAREMIQRKRTRTNSQSSNEMEESLPRLLCLLECLEERKWDAATADLPLWSLVPIFLDCLNALTIAASSRPISPKRRRQASLTSTKSQPHEAENSDDSEEESEVIADYEEAAGDATKALAVRRLLSALLCLLQAIPAGGAPSDVNLEPLLDCLTASFERQVRQGALLVVSEAARLRPALLLHNLLPLLTFMRRHVFPLDDSFTLQVIGRVLDSVVPAYVRAGSSGRSSGDAAALRVLAVLVDSFHHMPAHRRQPLFSQLGCSLADTGAFAGTPWPLLALLADRLAHEKKGEVAAKKRLSTEAANFLCRLLASFPLGLQVRCSAQLLLFLRSLLQLAPRPAASAPPRRRGRSRTSLSFTEDPPSPSPSPSAAPAPGSVPGEAGVAMVLELVSVGPIMERLAMAHDLAAALASHLASPAFLSAFVNSPSAPEVTAGVESLLDQIFQLASLSAEHVGEGGWRSLLSVACSLLDKVHAFLPVGQHLAVVLRLCEHSQLSVQRKALELLHDRLVALPAAAGGQSALTALTSLLLRAADIAKAVATSAEMPSIMRQTALVCGKELTRLLAEEHAERFLAFLEAVLPAEQPPDLKPLEIASTAAEEEACVYILTAELLQRLPQAAGRFFQRLVGRVLAQLKFHWTVTKPLPTLHLHRTAAAALLCIGARSSVAALSRSDLLELVRGLAMLETSWDAEDKTTLPKLRAARRNVAETAGSKALLASLGAALKGAINGRYWAEVAPLMQLLERHVERLSDEDFESLQRERSMLLSKLCVSAIAVRHRQGVKDEEEEDGAAETDAAVEKAEDAAVFAVMTVLKKMEERAREELMGMLFEWTRSVKPTLGMRRQIAFFRLCDGLAASQPDLLISSCAHLEFFEFAAAVLKSLSDASELPGERELLLRALTSALSAFFAAAATAGPAGSLPVDEGVQSLIPALVGALELTFDDPEGYRVRCELFLLPCLAKFAEACGGDETLLRPLCQEVCERTKASRPEVRASSLKALTSFAERLGSVFETSVLQDALPYMAECLEDDDSDVQELAFEMCERIRRQCGGEVEF